MIAPSSIGDSVVISVGKSHKFARTYPARLNGIISQAEYQQSIININASGSISWKFLLILFIMFLLSIPIVCILMYNWLMESFPKHGRFLFVGLVVLISLSYRGIIYLEIAIKYEYRLQKAIAKESAKYSMRSPISCSWRLDVTQTNKPSRYTVSNSASSDQPILQTNLIESFQIS
jgi:hypothetical protein